MEKLFTVVVAREEDCKKLDRLIEDLGLNIADYDKSKKLKLEERMITNLWCIPLCVPKRYF